MNIVTGKVRASFVRLVEPKTPEEGKPYYSVQLIIDKDDNYTINKFKHAIEALKTDPNALNKWGGRANGIKSPLRDGDTDQSDSVLDNPTTYAGKYFINAKSYDKPLLLDENGEEYYTPDDAKAGIYSGCYIRAKLNLFAYGYNGNKGISCWINSAKKFADGEPLGAPRPSARDFDDDYTDGSASNIDSIL